MIDYFKDINPLLFLLLIVMTWNFLKYNNQNLILLFLVLIFYYYYERKTKIYESTIDNPYKLKTDYIHEKDIQKLNRIITRLVDLYGEMPTQYNNITFSKMPTRYIYILKNREILINLLNLRFLGTLHEIGYATIFGILEVFLKTYYKIITHSISFDNIENLKELHLIFHQLHEELLYNTPISKIKYNMTLYDLLNSNMKVISVFMIRKIRIIRALIDGKIK